MAQDVVPNLDIFETDKWLCMTPDQRGNQLQELENFYANKEGRPAITITYVPNLMVNGAHAFGAFQAKDPNDPNGKDTLSVDSNVLGVGVNELKAKLGADADNPSSQAYQKVMADYEAKRYRLICAVIHEGKHADQTNVLRELEKGHVYPDQNHPDLDQKKIQLWKEDKACYTGTPVSPGDNADQGKKNEYYASFGKYRYQPLENDAWNYARDEMDKIWSHQTEYEQGLYSVFRTSMNDADIMLLDKVKQSYQNGNPGKVVSADGITEINDEIHQKYQNLMGNSQGNNAQSFSFGDENTATHYVKNSDINVKDATFTPTKIGEIRRTLNGQMDEIIKQLKELNQERRQVEGALLTKEQAEKLAASKHLNGADKELDKQVQELQAKRDKLSQHKEDIIKYGKENGLDTTLWRHAPEIFKGEGLKYYESSMAAIEHNHKFYNGQETALQTSRDQLEARLQTPEAKSEIAKNSEEILVQDKERLAKLEGLDQKINDITNEKHDIMTLRDVIPSRKLDREIDVQGDPKNVQNLLSQTDQLKQQAIEMQQAQAQSCGQSM